MDNIINKYLKEQFITIYSTHIIRPKPEEL